MRTTLPRFRPLIQEQSLSNQNRSIMRGVTQHIFPLRADMARLRRFVDSYLNFVDDNEPPPFYFQPVAPLVIFELLYYPYLTVASRNLISYPQREMSFSIPLECYGIEEGALVFKQYATCIPFLYVDEELSVVSGRDLFGLPKVALKFEYLFPQVRPDKPMQIGRLTLRVPGDIDDKGTPGQVGDRYVPFIDVYREPSRFASARRMPSNLVSAWADGINGYSSVVGQAWEAMLRPPAAGFDNRRDYRSALGMSRAGADALASLFPMFQSIRQAPSYSASSADDLLGPIFSDLITLKQVRDAENTDQVSFQSLVRSAMVFDCINDGGPLFGPFSSDPLGDVTVNIHRTPDQPVIESLGLITDENIEVTGLELRGPRDRPPVVSTLRPIFPYWLNVDLAYGLGTNLYWRGRGTDWSSSEYQGPSKSDNRYLTFGSGALQEDAARIVSPKSTTWVLNLLLDPRDGAARLNRLCSEYLRNDHYAFQLAPMTKYSPLWMFIRNLRNTAEGRGPDAEQELEFAALLQMFRKRNGRAYGQPLGGVLMPIYAISDNQTAAFTGSEVFGRPVVRGEIVFASNRWTLGGRITSILQAKTVILPELYTGGSPDPREIVSLEVKYPPENRGSLQKGNPPSPPLLFPSIGLKQVEDCRLPHRADFQAIVLRVIAIGAGATKLQKSAATAPESDQNGNAKEPPLSLLDESLWSIKISRYRSLPLVQKMGLMTEPPEIGEHTTVEVIKPYGVWAINASIEEKGAINLVWRLGDSPWISAGNPLRALEKLLPGIGDSMSKLPQFMEALFSF